MAVRGAVALSRGWISQSLDALRPPRLVPWTARAFAAPKQLRPRRQVKPGGDDYLRRTGPPQTSENAFPESASSSISFDGFQWPPYFPYHWCSVSRILGTPSV